MKSKIKVKFNHDAETMLDALGLKKDQLVKITEIVSQLFLDTRASILFGGESSKCITGHKCESCQNEEECTEAKKNVHSYLEDKAQIFKSYSHLVEHIYKIIKDADPLIVAIMFHLVLSRYVKDEVNRVFSCSENESNNHEEDNGE